MHTIENIVGNPDCIYLEERKKKYLIESYQKGIEKRISIGYKAYENAAILPVRTAVTQNGRMEGKVGVLEKDGTYIEESFVDNLFGGGYIPEVFQASGKTAAYLGCDHNAWGHFLVNVVPRIWIALEHDSEIDEYVIARDMEDKAVALSDNQVAFFAYLGILDKVRIVNFPTRYAKVIVPEASYRAKRYAGGEETETGFYYDEFPRIFDVVSKKVLESYGERGGREYKKVFFSRPSGRNGRKTDIGVELIDSLFRNNGYSIVYPEAIPLGELIYCLHHCEAIAYLSGTLQHNMLFAPQGMEVVAVERRIILSINQTDIDLIKKIRAAYVSAQYTILPGNRALSSIYAYSSFLQRFIRDYGLNLPDCQYAYGGYLKKCMIEYLSRHTWTCAWEDTLPSPYNAFYFETLAENLGEVGRMLPEIGLEERGNIKDPAYWKEKFQRLLALYDMPYSGWDESNTQKFIKAVCVLIEGALKEGKNQFLLYPYSANGFIIEAILRQRYGIAPQAIFDNGEISDYNRKVMKLDEMPRYLSEKTCVILTACRVECRKALERYCRREMVVGPYTVF